MVHSARRKEFVVEGESHFAVDFSKGGVDGVGVIRGTTDGGREGAGEELLLAVALLHELAGESLQAKQRAVRKTRNTVVSKTERSDQMFTSHGEIGRQHTRWCIGKAVDRDVRHLFMEHEGQERSCAGPETVADDNEFVTSMISEGAFQDCLDLLELSFGTLDHSCVGESSLEITSRGDEISEGVFEMEGASDRDDNRVSRMINSNKVGRVVIITGPLASDDVVVFNSSVLAESSVVDGVALGKALGEDIGLFV